MPSKTSRVRKAGETERTYRGEKEALFLVRELNKGLIAHGDSLRGIILALQDLSACQSMSQNRLRSSDPKHKDQLSKVVTATKAINKVLRQYEAQPSLRPLSPLGEDGFRLEWRRIEGDDLELLAVLNAVKLAQEGRIASLKQCPNPDCKRWLFARFPHQRFCSEACKGVFRSTDEQEKARRRDWAKNYYWIQKNKNVK